MICSSPEEFASAIAEHGGRVEAGTARRDPVVFRAIDETFLETHEPLNMQWALFEGVEFNNVLLGPWATFQDARFVNCTFRNCMIYGVFFRAGILEMCRIEKTTLIGCSFLNSSFVDTTIEDTQFVHGDLRLLKWHGCHVRQTRLMLLSAKQADWSNCEFTGCDVFDTLLDEATISGCRFVGGSMCRVSTRGTRFERSTFDGVKVLDMSFDESSVPDASTSSGMLMRLFTETATDHQPRPAAP